MRQTAKNLHFFTSKSFVEGEEYILRERRLGSVENQECQTRYSSIGVFTEKFVCANDANDQQFAVNLLFYYKLNDSSDLWFSQYSRLKRER